MHIVVGSKNIAKVQAVENVFKPQQRTALAAPSNVSSQPCSDTETRRGAINRAIFAQQSIDHEPNVFGVGLEGGVMAFAGQFYLCNWGALALPNKTVIDASGVRILLPENVSRQLRAGKELGEIMVQLTNDHEIRQQIGAVGVLTNNHLTRKMMYMQIVQLLKGQWEFQNRVGDGD